MNPTSALVGQQVFYRARILRRLDVTKVSWVQPLAFPDIRAEWLPGRAEDTRVVRDGATYLVREEQRALFPNRPQRLRLPAFQLRARTGG